MQKLGIFLKYTLKYIFKAVGRSFQKIYHAPWMHCTGPEKHTEWKSESVNIQPAYQPINGLTSDLGRYLRFKELLSEVIYGKALHCKSVDKWKINHLMSQYLADINGKP